MSVLGKRACRCYMSDMDFPPSRGRYGRRYDNGMILTENFRIQWVTVSLCAIKGPQILFQPNMSVWGQVIHKIIITWVIRQCRKMRQAASCWRHGSICIVTCHQPVHGSMSLAGTWVCNKVCSCRMNASFRGLDVFHASFRGLDVLHARLVALTIIITTWIIRQCWKWSRYSPPSSQEHHGMWWLKVQTANLRNNQFEGGLHIGLVTLWLKK